MLTPRGPSHDSGFFDAVELPLISAALACKQPPANMHVGDCRGREASRYTCFDIAGRLGAIEDPTFAADRLGDDNI